MLFPVFFASSFRLYARGDEVPLTGLDESGRTVPPPPSPPHEGEGRRLAPREGRAFQPTIRAQGLVGWNPTLRLLRGPGWGDISRPPLGDEADQETVQWTVFPPNARARLRGPGGRARSDLLWANLTGWSWSARARTLRLLNWFQQAVYRPTTGIQSWRLFPGAFEQPRQ